MYCSPLIHDITISNKIVKKMSFKKMEYFGEKHCLERESLFLDLGHKKGISSCLSHPHKTPGSTPTNQPGHGTNKIVSPRFTKVTLGIALTL